MLEKTPVRNCMSKLPHEVRSEQSVGQAQELMARHCIGHLPVMRGAKLHGVLSRRDVDLVVALGGEKALELPVAQVCSTDLYTVSPVASVAQVAAGMLERNIHSAVVVDAGTVVGIFTPQDALTLLARTGD